MCAAPKFGAISQMTDNRGQKTEGRGQRCCRGRAALLINVPHSGTQKSVFCLLMKQLAIRLGWQTTPAKSLVMSSVF